MTGNRARPTRFGTYGSPSGLFLCAVFLGPALLFMLAREDRRARGKRYTAGEIADMIAMTAAVLAIDGAIIFWFS